MEEHQERFIANMATGGPIKVNLGKLTEEINQMVRDARGGNTIYVRAEDFSKPATVSPPPAEVTAPQMDGQSLTYYQVDDHLKPDWSKAAITSTEGGTFVNKQLLDQAQNAAAAAHERAEMFRKQADDLEKRLWRLETALVVNQDRTAGEVLQAWKTGDFDE